MKHLSTQKSITTITYNSFNEWITYIKQTNDKTKKIQNELTCLQSGRDGSIQHTSKVPVVGGQKGIKTNHRLYSLYEDGYLK